jgi:hypothetical protein
MGRSPPAALGPDGGLSNLFDYLVSEREQSRRNLNAERFCGPLIDRDLNNVDVAATFHLSSVVRKVTATNDTA